MKPYKLTKEEYIKVLEKNKKKLFLLNTPVSSNMKPIQSVDIQDRTQPGLMPTLISHDQRILMPIPNTHKIKNKSTIHTSENLIQSMTRLILEKSDSYINEKTQIPSISNRLNQSNKINVSNKPYITIIKVKCMMYIIHIIKDELIKMGWECSLIDIKDVNSYIYLNNSNHYFLFLLTTLIDEDVIDYKRYILYQLEQNINELSDHYKELHDTKQLQKIYDNARLLIDYSEININVTKKYYSNEFKLINIPAINKSYSICENRHNYEYDIIFIGKLNKRRVNILNELKKKYKVLIVETVYGEELKKLCNKSNICLNIHYYENAILERVRLNEMMDYGIKIISEKPCDQDICQYYKSVHFIETINDNLDEMITTIEKIKYSLHDYIDELNNLNSIFKEDINILNPCNYIKINIKDYHCTNDENNSTNLNKIEYAEYPKKIEDKENCKILILYVFHQINDRVIYFINHGIFYYNNIDYIIICNNKNMNLTDLNIPDFVKIVYRENTGYDFGGWSYGLLIDDLYSNYDYFICLNSSVYGPFTKKKWTDYYINNLSEDVRLFGSTINCCGNPKKYAHVQSYVFSMNLDTLKYLIKCEIFSLTNLSKTFDDCIRNKEILMSQKILENGWNISSLYPKYYKNIDFTFKSKSPIDYNIIFLNDILNKNEYYKSWMNESLIFVKGNRDYEVKL